MHALKGGHVRTAVITVAAITVIIAAILLFSIDPETSVYYPKCLFYMTTGLKCPGCGSQRAIHELLHLHIGSAFRYNALAIVAIPFLGFLSAAWLMRGKHPGLYEKITAKPVILTVLAVIALWWIIRNVLSF